jgi:hypothetical protein
MQCNEFLEYASEWTEGERSPAAESHLRLCGRCRALLADLEAIQVAAHQFSETTDAEPPARLWPALRAELEAEGLIRSLGWTERLADALHPVPRPALAGACVCLLLIAALLAGVKITNWQKKAPAVSQERSAISSLPTQLANAEQPTVSVMHEHNPEIAASYRQSLATVDNFIVLCEKSVREEPENELAREYLYGAYQQKAELLGTMMERGVTAD